MVSPLLSDAAGSERAVGARSRTRPGRVLCDKAYSTAAIRAHLRRRRIKATIPEPADQARNRLLRGGNGGPPAAVDVTPYKQRNVVERAFSASSASAAPSPPGTPNATSFGGTVDVASG